MSITVHVHQIYIAAPAAAVWQALTDPHKSAAFFDQSRFVEPPQPGQGYRMANGAGQDVAQGNIKVMQQPGDGQPGRLVQTFSVLHDAAMSAEVPSVVEWTVTEVEPKLTRVEVVHRDLAESPATWAYAGGQWPWVVSALKSFCENGTELAAAGPPQEQPDVAGDGDARWHRKQGIAANNSVRPLLEARDPATATPQDDAAILDAAHAAAYHWARAERSGPINQARGAYMVSHAHRSLGSGQTALRYAELCLQLCEEHGFKDFDLAYAHEAMARALFACGDHTEARRHMDEAHAIPIADADDRRIVEQDLAVALG